MMKKTLLIEIGTEELPSRLLYKISLYFCENFKKELEYHNIKYKNITPFCTPRRLSLIILDIDTRNKIIEINKKGPSIINSYNEKGIPTEAAYRWAKYCGININQASRIKTEKGEWLYYQIKQKQKKIELLIPNIIEKALKNILISKFMRWEVKDEKFFRPIRNVVILLDNKIIKGKIFNIQSNNILYNHIAFKEEKIKIKNVKEYPLILFKKNNIIADYNDRKQKIIKEITKSAKKINGFIKNSNFLIEEITSLVESPTALLVDFEKTFLSIPKKILINIIQKQQKCFPIYDIHNNVLPYFIFVSNINSEEPEEIIEGNKKVMHARLSDAAFFFKNDKKIKLQDYLLSLKKVLFQKDLGSLYEKTCRLKLLIIWISEYTYSNKKDSIRAAILSKCDLLTNMVSEFPELQGIVGMYYALEDKEKKDIAVAIKEQYLPSFSGDKVPYTLIGCSLSIADKIDTLSGMFCIGNVPSSDKDPFALRRLALGILRIIIIKNIPLDLKELINQSLFLYDKKYADNLILNKKILKFFMSRLFYWYEERGYHIKIIKSVLSCKLTKPVDIDNKIEALSFFKKLDYSKSIILSIKRISNILRQEKQIIPEKIDIQLIKKQEEIILLNQIKNFDCYTKNLFKEKKYKEILLKTKELQTPIDNFFNKVKIHHFNNKIRLNRLTLLKKIKKIFFEITDFYYLY